MCALIGEDGLVIPSTAEDAEDGHGVVDGGERDDHALAITDRAQPRPDVVAGGPTIGELRKAFAVGDDRRGEVGGVLR